MGRGLCDTCLNLAYELDREGTKSLKQLEAEGKILPLFSRKEYFLSNVS